MAPLSRPSLRTFIRKAMATAITTTVTDERKSLYLMPLTVRLMSLEKPTRG